MDNVYVSWSTDAPLQQLPVDSCSQSSLKKSTHALTKLPAQRVTLGLLSRLLCGYTPRIAWDNASLVALRVPFFLPNICFTSTSTVHVPKWSERSPLGQFFLLAVLLTPASPNNFLGRRLVSISDLQSHLTYSVSRGIYWFTDKYRLQEKVTRRVDILI